MKKTATISFITTFLALYAAVAPAAEFTAKQPIVISSAGQSADLLMVKILAEKSKLTFTYDKLVTIETLKGNSTLILVSGGSTKGLGAAGIDKDQELSRIQGLIAEAKKSKMSIITMHIGGKARRGTLSDAFNTVTAENADCLIVVREGDEDKFFETIATKRKIPIFYIEKIVDAGDVLNTIFSAK